MMNYMRLERGKDYGFHSSDVVYLRWNICRPVRRLIISSKPDSWIRKIKYAIYQVCMKIIQTLSASGLVACSTSP